jgi:abequosyltransferase
MKLLEDKKILLSILIPTYNRASHLDKALNTFFNQLILIENFNEKIEILVSDNCSQDNTQNVLNAYSNRGVNYRFWKNDENIGFDKNFYKLVKESKGKYCWIFGDDEYLVEAGLNDVMLVLTQFDGLGHIYINNAVQINSLELIKSKNVMVKKVNFMISFITANIFNKEKIDWSIDYEKFMGLNLIQEMFYFQSILKSNFSAIINKKIFDTDRASNIGGYSLFKTFGENQQSIFNYFKDSGLTDELVDEINNKMLRDFFPLWIYSVRIAGSNNKFENEDVRCALELVFDKYKYYWIFCYPIVCLPLMLANIYCIGVKIISKVDCVVKKLSTTPSLFLFKR